MAEENGGGTQNLCTPQVTYKVMLKEIEYTKGVIRIQWQKDKYWLTQYYRKPKDRAIRILLKTRVNSSTIEG